MNDKDLIQKIKLLKSIEPKKNWAYSVKQEILSADSFTEAKFSLKSILEMVTWKKN